MNGKKKIIRATTVPQSLNGFCKGMLRELSEKYEVVAVSSSGEDLDIVGEREGVRTIAGNQGDRNFHTLTIHQYTQYIP